jgi:hypothetical protein
VSAIDAARLTALRWCLRFAGAYYGSGYYGNYGCSYDQYSQYICPQQGYYYNQY